MRNVESAILDCVFKKDVIYAIYGENRMFKGITQTKV